MIEEKSIEYKRCRQVVKELNKYFKDKSKIANIDYPSEIKYSSNRYYIYMFYSCLLDYGMRSAIYHKNLINTYEKYPNVFDPSYVNTMNELVLKNIIVNNIHPRFPNVAVKKWLQLSKSLVRYENISNCLKNIDSFEQLENFIKNIGGYGQKTGGLLIRIICDSNICNFKESIKSIPIDRHDIKISYLVGIISDTNIKNKDIKNLSDAFVRVGKELNISPSSIDKYLWEIGNLFCNKKQCSKCPINKYCKLEKNKK